MAARQFKFPVIPPLNGLPAEQKVNSTQVIPANIFLVRLGNQSFDRGEPVEKLKIQSVPGVLNVENTANWAIIPTIGRNNPFYHYTGGEDVLKFTLDWYSASPLRDDVIRKCRWVESLSRSDGYKLAPPSMLLIWGDVFKFDRWIITSAPYKLSLFDREYGMLPRQAYQELTLKKVIGHNTTIRERRQDLLLPKFTDVPTNYGSLPA